MAFFDKMKDSFSSIAGQGVSQVKDSLNLASTGMQQKAKTVTETTRINAQIRSNEKMIEKLIYQVGDQCVRNHIQEENSEYGELFREILRLREENEKHQEMIQKINTLKACPKCGFNNISTAKFCVSCGALMNYVPVPQPSPIAEDGYKVCPVCGKQNDSDAMFCLECGNSLKNISIIHRASEEPFEEDSITLEPKQTTEEQECTEENPDTYTGDGYETGAAEKEAVKEETGQESVSDMQANEI